MVKETSEQEREEHKKSEEKVLKERFNSYKNHLESISKKIQETTNPEEIGNLREEAERYYLPSRSIARAYNELSGELEEMEIIYEEISKNH